MEIVKKFGWPRSVYTNNSVYFLSVVFAKVLSMLSVRYMPAPKSYPQSVELAKRYMKLLVNGLNLTIMEGTLPQEDWDLVVYPVVHAVNKRVLCVDWFSPAKLLLEYSPNRTVGEVGPDTQRAVAALSLGVEQGWIYGTRRRSSPNDSWNDAYD